MYKKIKRLFVKALRSGEYQQGLHQLKKETLDGKEQFCCLGVLCDLYIQSDKGKRKSARWKENNFFSIDTFNAVGVLPEEVAKWAGLGKAFENGDIKFTKRGKTAICMNDEGKSFDYIADKVEEYL